MCDPDLEVLSSLASATITGRGQTDFLGMFTHVSDSGPGVPDQVHVLTSGHNPPTVPGISEVLIRRLISEFEATHTDALHALNSRDTVMTEVPVVGAQTSAPREAPLPAPVPAPAATRLLPDGVPSQTETPEETIERLMKVKRRAPAAKEPPTLNQVVEKMRMSVPILKSLWMDDYLRQFFLTQLVSMNHKKGMSVLVSAGMLVNKIPPEDYRAAMDAYAGVNGSNLE